MFKPFVSFVSLVSLAVISTATSALAQTTDVIGIRAQGMAGAFTAVADDASAGWWNPAGLAGGPFVNGIVEYGNPVRSADESVRGFATAYPALGVIYYRLPVSQIRQEPSTTAPAPVNRQDQGNLSLFGVTVGQSLGQYVVIGTTLKLLHANDWSPDLDVGALLSMGPVRAGVTLRNVAAPSFGTGVEEFSIGRHARAGFALSSGRRGVIGSATVSADFDLTREVTVRGDERRIAVGGEAWAPQQTLGVRGGFSRNTVGLEETLLSGGISLAIRKGTFVDAYVSTGDQARHGWGIGLRVTF